RTERRREIRDAQTLFNAVGAGAGSLDADRALVHAELLLLCRALRHYIQTAADYRANARVGASLLAAVGRARAGCVPVHSPLSDRSRALVSQLDASHCSVCHADDRSSRDLFDHRLAAARRGLSGPDFDPGFVFVGYSLQPS